MTTRSTGGCVPGRRTRWVWCTRAGSRGIDRSPSPSAVPTDVEGLADALYERLLGPQGWLPYADTEPTLRTLHEAGIKVAVISNIGFDIRPHFAAWGLTSLVDAFALSYEVGRTKPDPAIFLRACG